MPTYEYACQSCGRHIEIFQRFAEEPLTKCSECGGPLRKVFHPAGILFKGSGFYATDSRRADASKSSEGTSPDSKSGDSKSGDSKSGDSKSGDSKSGDSKSGDSKSGDSKSGDSKSGDSKSGDGGGSKVAPKKKDAGTKGPAEKSA